MQLPPVSYQVSYACKQHVAQTKRVVGEDTGEHAPLGARPLGAFEANTVPGLGGEERRGEGRGGGIIGKGLNEVVEGVGRVCVLGVG